MTYRKIRVRGKTEPKVDAAMVAEGLGAKIVDISEISREDSEGYQQVGSPVMVPEADKLYIYHFGSRMLQAYQKSLDDVVGYRILDADEEPEFRKQYGNKYGNKYGNVVRYYAKKQ